MPVLTSKLDAFTLEWVKKTYAAVGWNVPESVDFKLLRHLVYIKAFDKSRDQFIRRFARSYRPVFQAAGTSAAASYRRSQASGPIISYIQGPYVKSLRGVSKVLYPTVGRHFGAHALQHVTRKATAEFDPMSSPRMRAWMQKSIGTRIGGMSKSAGNRVRDIIERGARDNSSIDSVAGKLENSFNWGGNRAELVARTEVRAAANAGSYFSILENIGEEGVKHQWLALLDDRVRPSHEEANEQVKPILEPFEVGDDLLQFPGDDSYGAGPEEICNCRCTEVYEIE